jgi:hypothetical protein
VRLVGRRSAFHRRRGSCDGDHRKPADRRVDLLEDLAALAEGALLALVLAAFEDLEDRPPIMLLVVAQPEGRQDRRPGVGVIGPGPGVDPQVPDSRTDHREPGHVDVRVEVAVVPDLDARTELNRRVRVARTVESARHAQVVGLRELHEGPAARGITGDHVHQPQLSLIGKEVGHLLALVGQRIGDYEAAHRPLEVPRRGARVARVAGQLEDRCGIGVDLKRCGDAGLCEQHVETDLDGAGAVGIVRTGLGHAVARVTKVPERNG